MPHRFHLLREAGVFGGLYLVQGMVYGFTGYVLIPQLVTEGVTLADQGLILGLAGLPWALKLLWAPLIDHPRVRRRSELAVMSATALVGVALMGLALAATASLRATPVLATAWLLVNLALSLQDVATDALALDRVAQDERGRVNSAMSIGHQLGSGVFTGIGLAALAHHLGIAFAVGTAGVVTLVLGVLPRWLGHQEAPGSTAARLIEAGERVADGYWPRFAATMSSSVRRRTLMLALLLVAPSVVTSSVSGSLFVGHLGWTPLDLAQRIAVLATVSTVIGYALSGWFADRWGHRPTMATATVLLGCCWIGFAFASPLWPAVRFIQGFVVIESICTALLFTSVYALFMDEAAPALRASGFVLLTAALNTPRVWAPLVAAPLLDRLSFTGLFALCGVVQALLAILLIQTRSGQAAPRSDRDLQTHAPVSP